MTETYTIGDWRREAIDGEVLPAKVLERDLPNGKWKIGFDPGHDVSYVHLVGLRSRPFPLMRATKEEFFERVPQITEEGPNKGRPIEGPFVVRGVPVTYLQMGQVVYLWPIPAHDWKIRIGLNKKPAKVDA